MKILPIIISLAALAVPAASLADPLGTTPNPAADTGGAPSAAESGVPASVAFPDPNAPLGSPQNPAPQSSPTPPDQASGLTAGDATVVSNGPVPDTRANRARYGEPMSQSGRLTQPAGD